MPRVDRRIKKTKDAINQAFIELMAEQDFDKITINDISERANMNRGTIYLHYMDKFDLLEKCIEEHLDYMLKFCTLVNPDEKSNNMFQCILSMFQYFEANILFYSSMLKNKGTPCFHGRLLLIFMYVMNERMKTGDMSQEGSNEIVMQFMASAFVGVVEWWIKNNMPHSPQYMAQHVWGILEKSPLFSPEMAKSRRLS
jgi:AcrR family transcriptional regulator